MFFALLPPGMSRLLAPHRLLLVMLAGALSIVTPGAAVAAPGRRATRVGEQGRRHVTLSRARVR